MCFLGLRRKDKGKQQNSNKFTTEGFRTDNWKCGWLWKGIPVSRTLCKAVGGRLLSVWMMVEGIPVARTLNKATKKIGGQSQGNVDNNNLRAECTSVGLGWLLDWGDKPGGTSGFYILRGASEALTGKPVWPLVGWYHQQGSLDHSELPDGNLLDHVKDPRVIWDPVEAFFKPVPVLVTLLGAF